jgi:endoglucanase
MAGCSGGGVDSDVTGVNEQALSLAPRTPLLYIPPPSSGSQQQVVSLVRHGKFFDAVRLTAMLTTPQAVWLERGTPDEVEGLAKATMVAAAQQRRVPVFVVYNLPFRDCAQYSAGGAADTAAYEAWIDGVVRGIGKGKAIVVLEPDGLGIIPNNTSIYGAKEWCQPEILGPDGVAIPAPGANADERYAQLQYAGAKFKAASPNASVYLDGTHSDWLGVGEAAYRIYRAGHDPVTGESLARGFVLNTSNYRTTEQNAQFGTWVSMCTASAANAEEGGLPGTFGRCASQYNPNAGFALDYSPEYVTTVTAQLQGLMGSATATLPFVIDTSRNGRGPLDASRYAAAPYNQPANVISALAGGSWCNGPGSGVGRRPTMSTHLPLVDAFLWLKIPGQSDGSCDIAGGARGWDYATYTPWQRAPGDSQNHFDPLWATVDPTAGAWFPEMALELAKNANPPLF